MLPVAPPVEGRYWLTTDQLAWPSLRGQVVVVVFWSFGCEASLLALRRLTDLMDRWPDGGGETGSVTVLAVHTPRFPYEDDPDRVARAIAQHHIELPVIHDPDYLTWNRYNPGGWPATAVIGRSGKVVGITAGADDLAPVDEAVQTELDAHWRGSDAATMTRPEIASPGFVDEDDLDHQSSLRFPTGIATFDDGTLVVADGGNDRVLIGDVDADLRTYRPQMEITDIASPTAVARGSESVVYVIEGGTGSVLQLDLHHGTLDVLADEELAVPTALLIDSDGSLVVADAGHDQLFRIAPGGGGDVVIGPIAGTGVTGSRDGDASVAELAQPVGLARTAAGIVFGEAASSNLRLLTDEGRVLTVTGNDFYDWGLVDGPARHARLQRPTGLCVTDDGSIIVADTGNSRLRMLADRRVSTLGLTGLEQPTSVAPIGTDKLVVTDTGNHRLVVADPARKTGWPLAVYPASMTSVWEPVHESR